MPSSSSPSSPAWPASGHTKGSWRRGSSRGAQAAGGRPGPAGAAGFRAPWLRRRRPARGMRTRAAQGNSGTENAESHNTAMNYARRERTETRSRSASLTRCSWKREEVETPRDPFQANTICVRGAGEALAPSHRQNHFPNGSKRVTAAPIS